MAIHITFPDPADSPSGAASIRLRYGMHQRNGRTVPVLTWRSASVVELTQQAWDGYRRAGARITADTERERAVVLEALGINVIDVI